MTRREVFSQLNATQKLPTPSRVALEVMRLCHSDSASLGEIAKIIQTDPALSAELLKYANSSFMSTGIQVISVQKAAVKLGMQTLVNLALGFSLLSHNREGRCQAFNYGGFWSSSLARAIAAKSISSQSKGFDPEELFVCGLLAQIGKLAFASIYPEKYCEILIQQQNQAELLKKEKTAFGITNCDLTTELFMEWGLPDNFAIAAGCHNNIDTSDCQGKSEIKRLTELLQLSDEIATICQYSYPLPDRLANIEEMANDFSLSTETFSSTYDTIVTRWQEWGNMFKIPTQNCPLYHEIKSQEAAPTHLNKGVDQEFKVLIADDDPLTVLSLERLLKADGKIVFTASDGEEALQKALEHLPQLIITDWRMPKMTGLELCKILRNTSATQHVYIIMLTACEQEDEVVKAFDAGADDYVVKPFSPKVFRARIRGGERLIRYQKMINRDREVIQEYAAKLATANQKLQTMAMTDTLTGLPNRRYAMTRMEEAVTEASRHNQPLSCIMIDLDHFKVVNDTHGHHIGDIVLKEVADVFTNAARTSDTICRMGGEEFLIISSHNDTENTKSFAERIRKDIEHHKISVDDIQVSITTSLGVAQWNESMTNGEELIKRADAALYSAKRNGRNRVEVG